jgi:hypothetical protein
MHGFFKRTTIRDEIRYGILLALPNNPPKRRRLDRVRHLSISASGSHTRGERKIDQVEGDRRLIVG